MDLEDLRAPSAAATQGDWELEIADCYITGHIISPNHTYCGNKIARKDSITAPDSMTFVREKLAETANVNNSKLSR